MQLALLEIQKKKQSDDGTKDLNMKFDTAKKKMDKLNEALEALDLRLYGVVFLNDQDFIICDRGTNLQQKAIAVDVILFDHTRKIKSYYDNEGEVVNERKD